MKYALSNVDTLAGLTDVPATAVAIVDLNISLVAFFANSATIICAVADITGDDDVHAPLREIALTDEMRSCCFSGSSPATTVFPAPTRYPACLVKMSFT